MKSGPKKTLFTPLIVKSLLEVRVIIFVIMIVKVGF